MLLCTVSAESVASWTASGFFLCIYGTIDQPGLHQLTSRRSRPTPASSHLPWTCRKRPKIRPVTSLIEDTQVQNFSLRMYTVHEYTAAPRLILHVSYIWNIGNVTPTSASPVCTVANRSGLLRAGYCSSLQRRQLTQPTLQRWLLPCWLRRNGLRWMRTTRRPRSSTWELCLRKNPIGLKISGGWVKTLF